MAGLYIHIPLCKVRCAYCDFYSTTDSSTTDELTHCICEEIRHNKEYCGNDALETIYFGGGTPTQLSQSHFQEIFETIGQCFDLSVCKEITVEANPDDLTEQYIGMLRQYFNRISIGIQSLNDDELKLMNRRHNAQQAIDAVAACKAHGFENVSVDLIYGIPSQSLADFQKNIVKILEMNVQHLSAYHLTYEKGTVLYQKLQNNEIQAVDEELSVQMYKTLVEKLNENGIRQYEISNFARLDYESKHNSSYWQGKPYLGVGPSAHSYDSNSRKWNIASVKDYINCTRNHQNFSEIELLTEADKYNDFIITSLRTVKGASLLKIKELFGQEMYDYCLSSAQKYLADGTLCIENQYLKFSSKGLFIVRWSYVRFNVC